MGRRRSANRSGGPRRRIASADSADRLARETAQSGVGSCFWSDSEDVEVGNRWETVCSGGGPSCAMANCNTRCAPRPMRGQRSRRRRRSDRCASAHPVDARRQPFQLNFLPRQSLPVRRGRPQRRLRLPGSTFRPRRPHPPGPHYPGPSPRRSSAVSGCINVDAAIDLNRNCRTMFTWCECGSRDLIHTDRNASVGHDFR